MINDRIELIYSELLEKCTQENVFEFEYYWEMWGVLWNPWTIEINQKYQIFTLNDISENDLAELVRLRRIELIKTYDQSEMQDEFDRKRYKINSR
jgi:hypothetical protein